MFRPATPSWLTSTGPPLLWDDTSPKLRSMLYGKHAPPPPRETTGFSLLSFAFYRGKCVSSLRTSVLLSPQERFSHGWLPADISHARGAAGATEKLHPEQGDGLQRVQTVSIWPGARQLRAAVHWSPFTKHVLKTVVTNAQKQPGKRLLCLACHLSETLSKH